MIYNDLNPFLQWIPYLKFVLSISRNKILFPGKKKRNGQ